VSDTPEISPPGSWRYRRRIISATLIWCGAFVPVMTWRYPESSIVSQAVLGALALAGGTIGSYVFGATWDDKNARGAK